MDDIVEYDWELMHSRGLRWNRWCHMIAEGHEELMAMAFKLQLKPSWLQKPGSLSEHFDLIPSKRTLAIKYGAKALAPTEFFEVWDSINGIK